MQQYRAPAQLPPPAEQERSIFAANDGRWNSLANPARRGKAKLKRVLTAAQGQGDWKFRTILCPDMLHLNVARNEATVVRSYDMSGTAVASQPQ